MKKLPPFFGKETTGNKYLFWLWNCGMLLVGCVVLSVFSLRLAIGSQDPIVFSGFFANFAIFLINTLPIAVVAFLLYFIIGRSFIAFLITGLFFNILSVINYFKLILRDDPVVFSDVMLISTAAEFTGKYNITPNALIVFSFIFIAAFTVFLFFFAKGRIKKKFGLIAAAVTLLLIIFPIRILLFDGGVYGALANPYQIHYWSATETYTARGFVYPFIHSIPSAFPQKPAGYTDEKALAYLREYEKEDIPFEKKVDIIGIQLEAYNDLRNLGVKNIDKSVYEAYDKILENSISGRLVTNIFAGGTVDTERCVMTGDYKLENFRAPTGSYVRYMKSLGYQVEGAHPCYNYFYNRININEHIGFDKYYYFEDRYTYLSNGKISTDYEFFPDLVKLYENRDPSMPYFNLSVTYQGHGPYSDETRVWGDDELWHGKCEDESQKIILENYLGSVKNTGQCLEYLLSAFEESARPIVIFFFGDHNPWLGDGNSVYEMLGVNIDISDEEGFYNYYSTEYVIWGNKAARESIGEVFKGRGPDISPCYMMNVIFDVCKMGKGNEFMQLMQDFRDSGVSVINTSGVFIQDGKMTEAPKDEALWEKVQYAVYYRRTHTDY